MSRRQLSSKQHAFLEYLRAYVGTHEVWPTYREIVSHFGYRSPNSVTQNLQALSRKGFLERDRSGYRLTDTSGRDGSITVRGTIRPGLVDHSAGPQRLSLATLFAGHDGLHALRLAPELSRSSAEFGEAQYVLVDEGDLAWGDTALVLGTGGVSLARVNAAGEPESTAEHVSVVGRYVGHAGPYGIVRHSISAQPQATVTDEVPDGVAVLLAAEAQAAADPALSAPTAEALTLSAPSAEA